MPDSNTELILNQANVHARNGARAGGPDIRAFLQSGPVTFDAVMWGEQHPLAIIPGGDEGGRFIFGRHRGNYTVGRQPNYLRGEAGGYTFRGDLYRYTHPRRGREWWFWGLSTQPDGRTHNAAWAPAGYLQRAGETMQAIAQPGDDPDRRRAGDPRQAAADRARERWRRLQGDAGPGEALAQLPAWAKAAAGYLVYHVLR